MISVFYKQEQNVTTNVSFSPSAGKPEKVYNLFKRNPSVSVVSDWKPLSRQDLSLGHDSEYVNDVLDCLTENGFGNVNKDVAKSLPYTSGSFYNAAVHALKNKVAMSPTSGFHHAGYDSGGAFCTFNGLTITAQLLKKYHDVKRVGIIDFDAHYGNGTDDVINRLKLDYITHLTFGRHYYDYNGSRDWMLNLEKSLEIFIGCDILLYQAGADPHKNDPLGGYLSTEQMQKRDRIVFEFAKKHNIPIVWNLAGGYQEDINKVLDLHHNTLIECIEVFE